MLQSGSVINVLSVQTFKTVTDLTFDLKNTMSVI